MDKSIIQLVDELPTDNITVKVLKALDYVAPGEWINLAGFENNIRAITNYVSVYEVSLRVAGRSPLRIINYLDTCARISPIAFVQCR
jgi:hypothetical protein